MSLHLGPHVSRQGTRGFSLTELAVVLAVIAVVLTAIWNYAASASQRAKLETARLAVLATVEATRAVYASQPLVTGPASALVPKMVSVAVMPAQLVRSADSTCNGVSGRYVDSPWGAPNDGCGTFRVCAWAYGSDTACGNGAASPFFAVELTSLTYGACLELSGAIAPEHMAGLKDIYINGVSTASAGLPTPSATASVRCTSGVSTNRVDFVYALRVTGP